METIRCPECSSPLKLLMDKESFEGWRKCQKCGELSRVIATGKKEFSCQSLKHMLDEMKENKIGIQTLQFILDNGVAEERNIVFCVGKKSQTFLDLLVNVEILKRTGKKYRIKEMFKPEIKDYVENKIRKKSYNNRKARPSRVSV